MADVLNALTSKTGVVAALVVVLGLITTLAALARPSLDRRREELASRASLKMTLPYLGRISGSSNARDLSFDLVNTGGAAVVRAVIVRVVESHPSSTERLTATQAQIEVRQHRIELQPGVRDYDSRARIFGPRLPPLALAARETESVTIRLVSEDPQVYDLRVVVEWFDAAAPEDTQTLESESLEVDFPTTKPRFGRADGSSSRIAP